MSGEMSKIRPEQVPATLMQPAMDAGQPAEPQRPSHAGTVSASEMTAWLRAQVEADKAAANAVYGFWRAAADGNIVDTSYAAYLVVGPNGKGIDRATREYILRHDPKDAAAACDADLAALDLYERVIREDAGKHDGCVAADSWTGLAVARIGLRTLVSRYRHRAGWQEGWAELCPS